MSGLGPNNVLRCMACQSGYPAGKVTLVGPGARQMGDRVMGWCPQCQWNRLLVSEPASGPDLPAVAAK
jgi:hypothetical protein